MAIGAMHWDRDLTRPVDEVRDAPESSSRFGDTWPDKEVMCTIPEMRKGGIAAALVKVVACVKKPGHAHGEFRTADIAHADAMGQLAYYRILEKKGEARVLANKADFSAHVQSWLDTDAPGSEPVGFILGMEGTDAIVWPEQVRQWWEHGLRVISLSHYGVSYYSHGTGTGTDGGLTPMGAPLLREMDSLGMVLDVAHTSDRSVREAMDVFSGPVLGSHLNCRALVPGERQISDELLKRCLERDAVIGTSMDTWMLNRTYEFDWAETSTPRREVFAREEITLEDFADHIDHVNQLAGDSLHSAVGGDTDGQGGADGAPYGVDTVADYRKLAYVLAERGYSQDDIDNVMYRNWQRFFEKWLPD